jgi:hypothetical protein
MAPNQRHAVGSRHHHGVTFYDQFDAGHVAQTPSNAHGDSIVRPTVRIQDSQVIIVQPDSLAAPDPVAQQDSLAATDSRSTDPAVARFFDARRADLPVKPYPEAEAALALQDAALPSEDATAPAQDAASPAEDAAVASQAHERMNDHVAATQSNTAPETRTPETPAENRKLPIRPQLVRATEANSPAAPSTRLVFPAQSIAPEAIAFVHPADAAGSVDVREAATSVSISTTKQTPAMQPDDWIPITRLAIPGRTTTKTTPDAVPTIDPEPPTAVAVSEPTRPSSTPIVASPVIPPNSATPSAASLTMPAVQTDSPPTRLVSSGRDLSYATAELSAETKPDSTAPLRSIAPTLLPKTEVPSSPRPARLGSSNRRAVVATLPSPQDVPSSSIGALELSNLQTNPFVSRPVVELAKRRVDAEASIVRQPADTAENPASSTTEVR